MGKKTDTAAGQQEGLILNPDAGNDLQSAQTKAPELSVEEAFSQLEELIRQMEEDGISLEDSFACYEKGIRLIRYCNERIDRVEKKVQMLRGEGEAPLTEDAEGQL